MVDGTLNASFRRTLVGLKHVYTDDESLEAGFRRTLVGLKHRVAVCRIDESLSFQTNPCGVEACSASPFNICGASFRRTLVGLKPDPEEDTTFDYEFQTNPCGVEAAATGGVNETLVEVSDEPLWG